MNEITIKYPFMWFTRKVGGRVPTKWAELNESQFLAVAELIDGKEVDFSFLSTMTGIREKLLKKMDYYHILKLSQGIDFVGKAGNFHDSFFIAAIPGSTLTAPKPKLEAMTFGQFIFVDAWYNDWITVKHEAALNNFIASLYIPDGKTFSNRSVGFSIWKASRTDMNIRKAIALNWSLVSVWLQKAYPLLFHEPVEAAEPPKEDKSEAVVKQSQWIRVFESLVGDNLIERDRYADLPLHTVFRHLTEKYKESARKSH